MSRHEPVSAPMSACESASIATNDMVRIAAARDMIDRSKDALVSCYGENCFARFELRIPAERGFQQSAPNPFIRTPALP